MQARATAKTAATMEPRESILPAAFSPVGLDEAELELELELELPEELPELLDEVDDDDEEEVGLAALLLLEPEASADLEGAVSKVLGRLLEEAAGLLSSAALLEGVEVASPASAVVAPAVVALALVLSWVG